MPRKRRRQNGEGGTRKRVYKRADGSSYTRYSAVITLGYKDGKRVPLEGPSRTTEREALADLKELIKERDEGVLAGSSTTLNQFLDYWLKQIKPKEDVSLVANRKQLAVKTYSGYVSDVKNHIKPSLGEEKLRNLTPTLIQHWQQKLEQTKSVHVARGATSTLSSALTKAVQWRLLTRSPYEGKAVMKVILPSVEADYWEPSEAFQFINHEAVKNHPFYVALYVTLNLGFRLGELRGLQHKDIEYLLNKSTGKREPHVHVQRQAVDDKVIPTFSSRLKTTKSNRYIPLPQSCLTLLEQNKNYENVCVDKDGLVPTTGHLRQAFYDLCTTTKVRQIKLHGLRHTAGSLWIHAGVPLLQVSRWLGHSSMKTTEQIYIHVLKEASHGESLSLERLLSHHKPLALENVMEKAVKE